MKNQRPMDRIGDLAPARRLVGELRELGVAPAPDGLLPAVLAGAGLGDAYVALDTALGTVYVAYNAHGISAVVPAGEAGAAGFEEAFIARHGRRAYRVAALPAALARAVQRWQAGERDHALRFDLRGLSPFARAVLTKTLEIPFGEVRPYGWVAAEIGQPGAVRAVGTALGGNPVPLLIPCHRVVRSDGHVGNYALGRAAKEAVLAAEGVDAGALDRLAAAGVRYYGSDTTRIYCYPTCRHARRSSAAHRVLFRSAAAATASGYRPCKVCRPAVAA